jgi:hypothetical protein
MDEGLVRTCRRWFSVTMTMMSRDEAVGGLVT